MSTIADQLAGALREAMEWDWITDAKNIAPIVVAQCDAALSAYEASRHAPAVREVNSDDVDAAWDAYFDVTPKDSDFINSSGIGAALNSFRDKLNGEGE